jgi:hypothetical protein
VASSLFEAAAMALARFRRTGLTESAFGPATRLRIAARPPAEARSVTRVQGSKLPDYGRRVFLPGNIAMRTTDPRSFSEPLSSSPISSRNACVLQQGTIQ